MLKKISVSTIIFVSSIMFCSFANNNYSTNIIMPKTQNIGPDMGIAPAKQNTNSSTNQQTTENGATQVLTPEQLFQKQLFEAMQQAQLASVNQNSNSSQSSQMNAYANAVLDIPSGFTADGFAYGLARLAHNLSLKRGEVNFVSATKIKDKQYYVVCESLDRYANGTFLVDIFPTNETELKDGYQMWFTLYDIHAKKIGTAHAKKMHN